MKRAIFIIVIIGMFGWAIYDFVIKDDTPNVEMGEDHVDEDELATTSKDVEDGPEDEIGLDLGNTAPDFELSSLDGETLKLSDFLGEKVMVNFWASWCGPCRAEMPDMQKFYEDKDVVILAINLTDTENNQTDITDFMDEYGLNFPVLLDEGSVVSTIYQIKPIPTTYLIDSNGKVHNKAFGALNYEQMVQELELMD